MHFSPEQRTAWKASTKDSPFNRWLRAECTDRSGQLDLAALRSLADRYGIDAARYAHLNPGQQRMNIGNRLRKLVPAEHYLGPGAPAANGGSRVPAAAETPALAIDPTPPGQAFVAVSNADLMRLYASVIDELRARRVVRTGNAPLGDYAEHLFAKAFGWTLEHNSAAGHDAVDAVGLRFQIKARRLRTRSAGERQLSVIRGLPDAKFDYLAAVLFGRDFSVVRAALVPHAIVVDRSTFVAHVNGWRLIMDDSAWQIVGVHDVTSALAAAIND